MGGIGPMQILIIVVLVIVLFGARKLPEAARSLGRSMRIFKSEMRELKHDTQVNAVGDTASDSARPTTPEPQRTQEGS